MHTAGLFLQCFEDCWIENLVHSDSVEQFQLQVALLCLINGHVFTRTSVAATAPWLTHLLLTACYRPCSAVVTDVLDALTRISVQALQPVSLSQKALLYAVIIASNNQ